MLIIFSGLPGSGKSTISHKLSEQLNATYIRMDTIEQAIRNAGETVGISGYMIAYGLAKDNLDLGNIVVVDSVNPLKITRDAYRDIAITNDYPYLEIEIICSDQAIHRERVENRVINIKGLKKLTWHDVYEHDYEDWDRERLLVDSSVTSIDESVNIIIESMKAKQNKL